MGEFVLPAGGAAWTSALLGGVADLGVSPAAARQALMRMSHNGWIRTSRQGRRARVELTPEGVDLLQTGSQRIYGFGVPDSDWDHRWVLIHSTVPADQAAARDRLRTRLAWNGFGYVGGGLWLSPRADRVDDARRILAAEHLDSDAVVIVGGPPHGEDPRRLVDLGWDLAAVDGEYARFIADFDPLRPDGPAGCFVALTALVQSFRHFPFADPDLPAELLPPGWNGHRAVELFARRRAEWLPGARARWDELERGAAAAR
ncbi:MAG TPA: PaaX family transcriptional regulator [Acidimicrobiales bacterium]|nr:PaaX family transcriptional regulator [Acidimicrobiales bacterium]